MGMLRSLLLLFMISMGNARGKSYFRSGEGLTEHVQFQCPYGWTNFGVRCYKYFSVATNWITAEKNCQSLGANLASIHSKAEDDFLLSLLPASTSCWVGGHDGEDKFKWLWTDGSPHDYTNWCPGQPDNHGDESCQELNWGSNRCWNDGTCSFELRYICAADL